MMARHPARAGMGACLVALIACSGTAARPTSTAPLGAVLDPPPVALPASVVEDVHVQYYDVGGTTEPEVLTRLRTGRLDGNDGHHYQALTQWNTRWSYTRAAPTPSGCAIVGMRVILDVRMTLPHWVGPPPQNAALAEHWDRYIAALRRHEEGHRQIARAGAVRLAELPKTQMIASCAAASGAMRLAADEILAHTRDESAAYDRETQHGALQGASWGTAAPGVSP